MLRSSASQETGPSGASFFGAQDAERSTDATLPLPAADRGLPPRLSSDFCPDRSGRWSGFVELIIRSEVLDVEPNFGSFGGLYFRPGYVITNAGMSVRVACGAELFARTLNLADRSYGDVLGFPAPRRTGIVGVRIAASR